MELAIAYQDALGTIASQLGMTPGLMLVHAGMAIYLACLVLMGTRRGSLAAVLAACFFALVHEVTARLIYGGWNWHETTRALVLVCFWPGACYAVSRYRRWSWAEQERQRANDRLLHLYDYRPLDEGSDFAKASVVTQHTPRIALTAGGNRGATRRSSRRA